ncbi:hypothetical protein PQJ75_27860 [Rhodoplanes sp. TEM]|uniref:Uncharacterized protein n=1 Tax=Rhodoplanes tepidamans TaxID=200616 RepID=A0ABT5JIB5_RHOTP|nr:MULTISPECIES: hypothetical protein [Rhodoplanes]MDC7788765.1 hypothetical protein [Rhodoplanes tepidamans]MDC7987566.1 hypothetical protein [Rhodoplanes sp. TEM]MDQ0354586.1 putative membrane protein (GlpM family) [Rhodoplanes tepidamans]
MSPDLALLLPLASKMAITALIVVAATLAAERAGAVIGAMIATLPTSTGPAYVFLALDHGPGFIADAALASFTANIANGAFALAYVVLAQRCGTAPSSLGALACWFVAALGVQAVAWTTVPAAAAVFGVLIACVTLAARFRHARILPARRRWYDIPARALMVASLVGFVVTGSSWLGTAFTGLLSAFPVVLLSFVMILQPRLGGPPTAAIIANALLGLIGFSSACLTIHLAVPLVGVWPGLATALAVAIGFNLTVLLVRRPRPPKPRPPAG